MSVDVARLVFELDSTQADPAEKKLDRLIATGERADATFRKLKTATEMAGIGLRDASDGAQRAAKTATDMVQSQGAVEKATRGAAKASADLRAQRQLEAAAMREVVQASKAYERDQNAADRSVERSAAQVLAFRQRMARQRALEEGRAATEATAATAAADRAAERSAQQVLAFRVRMARQRANEEAAAANLAAKAEAEAAREQAAAIASLEQRIAALKGSIDPTFAAQQRLDAEMREATALYKMGAISASDYAKATAVLEQRMAAAARGQTLLGAAHLSAAGSSKVMTQATLNLSRQFADIGVTAAMGMNPLMILIQQGPQIADAFAMAKTQGLGFTAVLRGMLATLAPLLIAIWPLIIVAGAAAAGFALLNRELAKKYPKDITDGLGLTEEQLKRVKDRTVTLGDTFMATLTVMGRHLMQGPLGGAIKWLGDRWSDLMDGMSRAAFEGLALIIGGFVGAYRTIMANWRNFGPALGDVFTIAANRAIDAIEMIVNAHVRALNVLIAGINKIPGIHLPAIAEADLSHLKGQVSGAAEFIGKSFAANVQTAVQQTRAGMRQIGKEIETEALRRARARALEKAGDPNKGAATPRDQTDERTAQIQALLAQAAVEELQARLALTRDIQVRANLEKQIGAAQLLGKQAEVDRQIANIADDKGLSATKKAELTAQLEIVKGVNARVAGLKDRAIDEAAADGLAKQAIDIANAQRDGQSAVLQSQLALATTAKDRGAIEMQLLDLADQRAKAAYEEVIAAKASTATQVETAKIQLATLEATRGAREEAQRRKTAVAGADEIVKELSQIDSLASQAGQSLENAFGRAGGALGSLLSSLSGFRVQMAQINKDVLSHDMTEAQGTRERAALQVRTYGDMASAAKGFFKQGSAGYKAMEAAEKAFRIFQFAMAVKAMFFKTAETAATVTGAAVETGAVVAAETAKTAATTAGTAVRTPMKISEGAASMFAALGPFGFAAVAAMLAVMAALGFSGRGGSGGGLGYDPKKLQEAAGTGSVLGDSTAKSESIQRALDIVAQNTNRDLEYSNAMLRALRSIDNNIGVVAAALARSLGAGGAFDTSKLNLGTSGRAPTLGNLGFGSVTTKTLADQGLTFNDQALADILQNGIDGSSYQSVATKKKKSIFGITYSNKTSTATDLTDLDASLEKQLTLLVGSLRDGVLSAAEVLGVTGAKATLDAFTVSLGKLSFKDLTGEEIQQQLEAVFGKLGDDLASAVLPVLSEFQKVGEGAFETLVRVAREYQVVDVTLSSIGKTFGAVGVASLAARDNLVQLFGSLDDFVEQTSFFADNFLSEAERMAPIQAAVVKEFERLGVTGVNTKDQFKQLVLGLDLTTQAGRDMYAAMLAAAPAFAKVFDYLNPEVKDAAKSVSDLRKDLTDAYQREADALQGTIDKFKGFADTLKKFRDSLDSGPNALLSPEAQYQATQKAFLDVSAKARLGDADALSALPTTSQAFLDASKAYYASSGHYFRDLADVKAAVEAAGATASRTADNATQQLDALKASVSGLITINQSVISVHDAILALQTALSARAATAGAGGIATPFSPATSATGSTAPSYTYQPAVAPTTPAAVSTAPNWDSYLAANPDVMASVTAGWLSTLNFASVEDAARYHYENFGQYEGRTGFATGGSFMVGGSGGTDSQNFGPINLSPGEIVNVRRPGQGANDNAELIAELKSLKTEVVALRAQVARGDQANVEATKAAGEEVAKAVKPSSTQRLTGGGRA